MTFWYCFVWSKKKRNKRQLWRMNWLGRCLFCKENWKYGAKKGASFMLYVIRNHVVFLVLLLTPLLVFLVSMKWQIFFYRHDMIVLTVCPHPHANRWIINWIQESAMHYSKWIRFSFQILIGCACSWAVHTAWFIADKIKHAWKYQSASIHSHTLHCWTVHTQVVAAGACCWDEGYSLCPKISLRQGNLE